MKLKDWMEQTGTTAQKLSALVGTDVATPRGWVSGRTMPTPQERQFVEHATKGNVTTKDWK